METETLHDSVVVEEERLEPREVREVVDLPDLVVGEVDRVELVQRRAEVFDHRDFVAYGMSKKVDQILADNWPKALCEPMPMTSKNIGEYNF